MAKKEYNDYSETTKRLISNIDCDLEEGYTNFICCYDASVEDVMDALEHIIHTGWFGSGPLYARKVVCRDVSRSSANNDLSMAIQFATDLDDFTNGEKMNISYVIEAFPTIYGVRKEDEKNNQAIVRIVEDEQLYSYEEWRDKHQMNLKVGDPVVFCRSSENPVFEKTINTAYFTGVQEVDKMTGEILYVFADRLDLDPWRGEDDRLGRSNFYCKHGVDVAKVYSSYREEGSLYFLTFPEYRFQLDCYAEAVKKAQLLLNNSISEYKKTVN